MPRSQQPLEGENIILQRILSDNKVKVIDVGCGDGKWSCLRGQVAVCDGIEAWPDYVRKYGLEAKYDNLFVMDVKDFDKFNEYDVAIFGDVLEHLEYEDALKVVDRLKKSNITTYLIIPITLCVQDGAYYGNPYETHRYQWTNEELEALGFRQLHWGYNPNGLVKIGTYVLNEF